MNPPEPLSDQQLDNLFQQARAPSPADAGAAERFLARAELPLSTPIAAPPSRRLRLWPALFAAAALAGVLLLRPAPADQALPDQALPSSAAYEVYSSAIGSEW
ncbi:hypothetical protein [Deinococcus sp.]|uniref:hypothetical protein n=1 Tax=Deinococcus sp. TaxID=47478 RepID=UPI003B59D631